MKDKVLHVFRSSLKELMYNRQRVIKQAKPLIFWKKILTNWHQIDSFLHQGITGLERKQNATQGIFYFFINHHMYLLKV